MPVQEVDPVVLAKFKISKSDKVVTAGSCFAQHIARHLKASGFNFYVTERHIPLRRIVAPTIWLWAIFSTLRKCLHFAAIATAAPTSPWEVHTAGRFLDETRRSGDRSFRPTIQPTASLTRSSLIATTAALCRCAAGNQEYGRIYIYAGLTETCSRWRMGRLSDLSRGFRWGFR